MSNDSKAVLILLFSLITHFSFSMDKSPNTIVVENPSQIPQSSNIGSPPVSAFGCVMSFVASSLESLGTTVKNKLSDEEAFKKLGWPRGDVTAEMELTITLKAYVGIAENNGNHQEYIERIARRTEYLMRLLRVIESNKTNESLFVKHCLDHHRSAMPEFLRILFQKYVEKKSVELIKAEIDETEMVLQTMKLKREIEYVLLNIGWRVKGKEQEAKDNLKKCFDAYAIKKQMSININSLRTSEGRKKLNITESDDRIAMIADFSICRKFILDRMADINQIYNILPDKGDGLDIAVFCTKNHDYIMSAPIMSDFSDFIKAKRLIASDEKY
jgi:hypothetical protein